MDSLTRQIAFAMLPGINLDNADSLRERVGSVDDFFSKPTSELWQAIGAQKAYCTDAERQRLLTAAASEAQFVRSSHISAIPSDDESYPRRLALCGDAPALIYKLGNIDLDSAHVVAIVGTRKATAYGLHFVAKLVEDLARNLDNLIIVSGLAYGIDVAAHKAALSASVPTVGVVAHGLKTIYPAEHRSIAARMIHEGGGIVTEYTSDTPAHRGNFLARNRIVAGLSDVTVVVESDLRGGSMVTAGLASAYGREVAAAPGRATDRFSAGPNALIHDNKAFIIRDGLDLIEAMNWQPKPAEGMPQELPFPELTDEMRRLIDFLRAHPSATVDDMVQELAMPYHKLSANLIQMEMSDAITALPGGRYQLNI